MRPIAVVPKKAKALSPKSDGARQPSIDLPRAPGVRKNGARTQAIPKHVTKGL